MKVGDKIYGVASNFKFQKKNLDIIKDSAILFHQDFGKFKQYEFNFKIQTCFQVKTNQIFFGVMNISDSL